ncbi:MAG: nitrous oxide reductase family maturation protein NosD [Bacteroidia bacterium]
MTSRALTTIILLFIHVIGYSKTITVCSTCAIKTIKNAISQSQNGDVIVVKKGIYKETDLLIDKSIKLVGEDNPIVDAELKSGIFTVQNTRNVSIRGFYLKNIKISYIEDLAAIKIIQSNNCSIENNNLDNAYYGIYISKSDSCQVKHNNLTSYSVKESASGNGIHLWYCKNALIDGNKVKGHRDGIYFEFVENSLIKNNSCTEQIRYGLHFMFSHNCEYFKNLFKNNGAGVAIMYSKKIKMYYNKFIDNWSPVSYGILLKDISDSYIEKNLFNKNTMAIYAEGCNRNVIVNNEFSQNGWALKILGNCDNNTIEKNNFISNTFEVVTNSSRNNNYFENNYWSNYNGYDLNKDGIGDVPHSPITLFSYMIEQIPSSIVMLRSLFIDLLNLAEKITPVITPESYKDETPNMKPHQW